MNFWQRIRCRTSFLKPTSGRSRLLHWGLASAVLGSVALFTPLAAIAAEQVTIRYGLFSRSVPVSSLEAFLIDGTIDDHLEGYLGDLDPETLAQIQQGLSRSKSVNPIAFTQMLYTPMGERFLDATGLTVQTGARQNGQRALRAALIQAAFEPSGLSLINILRHFPTEEITLNLNRALAVKRHVEAVVQQTDTLIAAVAEQSAAASTANPVDYAALTDLRESGPYPVRFIPLDLSDGSRNRAVPSDLFLPEIPDGAEQRLPVLIFSHGLGHSRTYFRDVAEHLASHGIAVAMPDHVGSNLDQREALEAWQARAFFQQREFIDRPQDISFLLDELTRLNSTTLENQLNLEAVGVAGHSFGGYTVLAAAGATVDFESLRQNCDPTTIFSANLSQFLQCRALELENAPDDVALLSQGGLRDERVTLVMAFNPVSRLFGDTGISRIDIPTLLAGGAYDFVTPILPEQTDTFRWLETPERYFLLADQTAHSAGTTRLLLQFINAIEDDSEIAAAQQWLRSNYAALLVAFVQVYIAGREDYRPYLESAYAEYIGMEPFLMYLVRSLPEMTP